MKLDDFLNESGMSVAVFAKQIGLEDVRSIYRYINEERIPKRQTMMRISQVTGGKVTADDFYNIRKSGER